MEISDRKKGISEGNLTERKRYLTERKSFLREKPDRKKAIYDRKKKEDLIDLNIREEGNGLVIVPQ